MIRFSKYLIVYAMLSGIVIIPGLLSLVIWGLKPSIDFTGGTLFEVKFAKDVPQINIEKVANEKGVVLSSIQKSDTTYILRAKDDVAPRITELIDSVSTSASIAGEIVRQETVGPVLGKELLSKAVTAAFFAILVILSYVAYAFKNIKFGVSAIMALIHDLLVVLGCFSLFGHFFGVEVDTLFVTAFLTTMSFSVHDTIVVFDRIREYQRKGSRMTFEDISDRALTETMGRSLANSMTIIFMLMALVLMGGSTTYWFTVALLIGTISGTYSSDFVATPILILWNRWEKRKRK